MSQLRPPIGPEDHVLAGSNAVVSLVEFGDYECPFCGMAHRIVQGLMSSIGSQVVFAYRHFPLTESHPHAAGAALAAEAASVQGEFWAMHDTLFEHQDALDHDSLLAYAKVVGLDVERFAEDLRNGTHAAKLRRDFTSAVRSGLNGTPTFFIDGERFDGGWDRLPAALALAISGHA
jgi:protein-disulfide isomerase